jgi:hypothetical protein
MNYGELKTSFLAILNRRDITPTQITTFIGMGLQRIHREVRIPAMEALYYHTSTGDGIVPIPSDFVDVISIATNLTTVHNKLIKRDLQTVLDLGVSTGYPLYYFRQGMNWLIAPRPESGIIINVQYYRDQSTLSLDTDTNRLTAAAPDLIIYAALTYASDFFLDERGPLFEQKYQQMVSDLNEMAHMDELENAAIRPNSYDNESDY